MDGERILKLADERTPTDRIPACRPREGHRDQYPCIQIKPRRAYVVLLLMIATNNVTFASREKRCNKMRSILGCTKRIYILTPWCRVLLEKLTGLQLVQKFPAFHGTRRFITALTSVRHLSLSWVSPIQSIYPHPTSWRSLLILSTHLRLDLPSGLLPSGFPSKNLHTPSPHPYAPHAQPI